MTAVSAERRLASGRRIIIKIGSKMLVDAERGVLHRQWLESLALDIAACRARGQEVLVVSSGAIALGRRYLKLPEGDLRLEEKQAAAATGMVRLAHAFQETLGHHGFTVSQVLLTLEDSENRRRYLNARNTLLTLLRIGAIPLINENDTVATDEIRFGDNDRLAARVAAMVSADILVLLSDTDGFYSADPSLDPGATFIPEVRDITPAIAAMAGTASSGDTSGGMITKLAAARQCLAAGCSMVITLGRVARPIQALENGARSTWFVPGTTPQTARKRWIASALGPAGALVVDDGAMIALRKGKSLLPAGVARIEGTFERGDAVVIKSADGRELARGLSAYSAADARRIIGHKTGEIESILGYRGRDEMVHRDDLVLSAGTGEN
jgi:glutamate 5-kinase